MIGREKKQKRTSLPLTEYNSGPGQAKHSHTALEGLVKETDELQCHRTASASTRIDNMNKSQNKNRIGLEIRYEVILQDAGEGEEKERKMAGS